MNNSDKNRKCKFCNKEIDSIKSRMRKANFCSDWCFDAYCAQLIAFAITDSVYNQLNRTK